MKAAVLEGPGAGLVVRDIDIAEPIGREVLVDIKASGLCHSDLHMIENPAGATMFLKVGDPVNGAMIKAIYADRVIFSCEDQEMEVRL